MCNWPAGEIQGNIDECLLLKKAICQQDKKSLTYFYIKYYSHVKFYISSYINSVTDAEDLAQDVFVELCKGHGSYDASEKPEKYILGIAKNMIRRYLRTKERAKVIVRMNSISNIDVIKNIREHQILADQIKIQELNKSVKEAIEQLPAKTRQALTLRFIDGLSPKEAAKKAGCSENTFYQRVHSGIKAIDKVKKRGLDIEAIDMNK